MEYDYLIVGAGLFGCVFAREMSDAGYKCLIVDKREKAGGNCALETVQDIKVHRYGAHIFHTDYDEVWQYINRFCTVDSFINSPLACYKGRLYNLPFNMNTFYQIFGTLTPEAARAAINKEIAAENIAKADNCELKALSTVGRTVYETLIKDYTQKQWGRPPADLPAFIIGRLPLRFTFDNNYFSDKYQGIPDYDKLFNNLLYNIDTLFSTDYLKCRGDFDSRFGRLVFTGRIDEYYNNEFGALDYRSLRFEDEILNTDNYQGNAVVNYTGLDVPFTRIIEHKHFDRNCKNYQSTVITREYPQPFNADAEPYYPVNDDKNTRAFNRYSEHAEHDRNVIFGGRLAEYKYYDMDDVILSALNAVKAEKRRRNREALGR